MNSSIDLPPTRPTAVTGLLEAILVGERVSEAEERAVEEARQWLRHNGGKGIPQQKTLAGFLMSMDDFQRMCDESLRGRG